MTHHGRYETRKWVEMHHYARMLGSGVLETAVGPCIAVSVRDPRRRITFLGHFLYPTFVGTRSFEPFRAMLHAVSGDLSDPNRAKAAVLGASPELNPSPELVELGRAGVVNALVELGVPLTRIKQTYLERPGTLIYGIQASTGAEDVEIKYDDNLYSLPAV